MLYSWLLPFLLHDIRVTVTIYGDKKYFRYVFIKIMYCFILHYLNFLFQYKSELMFHDLLFPLVLPFLSFVVFLLPSCDEQWVTGSPGTRKVSQRQPRPTTKSGDSLLLVTPRHPWMLQDHRVSQNRDRLPCMCLRYKCQVDFRPYGLPSQPWEHLDNYFIIFLLNAHFRPVFYTILTDHNLNKKYTFGHLR